MNNLFSAFDPASFFGMPLNWVSAILILLFLPTKFWLVNNQPLSFLKTVTSQIKNEFKASLNSNSVPGILLISIRFFIFVALNNFLGLMPYVFTASSHMSFTLVLALPLWIGHMVLARVKTPTNVLAHLVPLGTPNALIPFIVLVEIVRRVIRPLTLSVRLAANITAGHLLLALLGGQGYNLSSLLILGLLIGLILLATLETAVSLIQAYVFSVLSTLYFNEVNAPRINY